MKESKNALVSRRTLKRYYKLEDWMIRQIGKPDTVQNYEGELGVELWKRQRIENWTHSNWSMYQEHLNKKRLERKAHMMNVAQNTPIVVDDLPSREELLIEMRDHYVSTGGHYKRSRNGTALVAYVRHNHTNYPDIINTIRGYDADRQEAYEIVKQRANDAVQAVLDRELIYA